MTDLLNLDPRQVKNEVILALSEYDENHLFDLNTEGVEIIVSSKGQMNCFILQNGGQHEVYFNFEDYPGLKFTTTENQDGTWNVLWD